MTETLTHEEYAALVRSGGAKGGKYRNKPVTIDGIRFVSRMEGRRYVQLRELQKHGAIRNLQLQTSYKLEVNGVRICTYRPDFEYDDVETGEHIVEDTKGAITSVYRIKKKLMLACHGVEIVETTA